MDATAYARTSLESCFSLIGMTMNGMTDEQFNWTPGGTANTPGQSHVHAITSADFFVNGMLAGKPLIWKGFAADHNLPENPMEIWKYEGTIPVAAMTEYAASVLKSVQEYVNTLNDDDLDREVDTQFFGKKTIAWVLQLAGYHLAGHAGDISAVKGMQGLKGLPF